MDVAHDSESALQAAVANVGPISVAIDASHSSFQVSLTKLGNDLIVVINNTVQLYRRGVYDEDRCSSERLDHGVLAVGYGESEGQAYWLVKNR